MLTFVLRCVPEDARPGNLGVSLLQSDRQSRDMVKRDKNEFDRRTNARILFIIPTR